MMQKTFKVIPNRLLILLLQAEKEIRFLLKNWINLLRHCLRPLH